MTATKLKSVDAVVIGMGVVGSIVSKELASTGIKVVGLERGRMFDTQHDFAMPYAHDELKFDRHSDMFQNLSRETITFRNHMGETALPMREMGSFKPGESVGGTALHWTSSAKRFLPWDFEVRSRTLERYGKSQVPEDCTSQDWGVTYEEIEPYYDQFEHIYGVGGKAGNLNGEIQAGGNRFEGPRSREFPNPPSQRTYFGQQFAKHAETLGYTPFQSPTAAMTEPYLNPYKLMLGQCQSGGFCTSHGCPNGAKANPLTAVIPALLKHQNFELRALCNVIRINLDSSKRRAVSVTYLDARGRETEQPADLIVLASYTFNNTRLMLLSGIGEPYDPISNRGVIGRNYSYQSHARVSMFFEDETFNPYMGGGSRATTIDDFNGDNFDHCGLDFIGGAYISANNPGAAPIRNHPVPPGTPAWGSGWKKAVARYYSRTLILRSSGSCMSYRGNYLDLDPTYKDANGLPLLRMTFDFHDNEQRMTAYVAKKSAEIARLFGAERMDVHSTHGKYSIVPYQSTHNIGGVIMGVDPSTSAVNKYLQSWDVPNLWVIGGSAFPQNGANPPTETIGMLACWAADAMKEQYLKRPAPLV
jgi:gluconate 2-dehydrogenase alpha chain